MSSAPQAPPFPAYRGQDPFLFACYAHADAREVYAELERLNDSGLPIWYDEGISPGRRWHDEIADAIDRSAGFIAFVSPRLVESPTCLKEINYAIARGKPFLAIHLRETHLTPGLSLATSDVQAIFKDRLRRQDYEERLLEFCRAALQASPGESSAIGRRPARLLRRALRTWAVGGLLTALALVPATWFINEFVTRPSAGVPTIAVLPFDTFSSREEDQYLSDGITEELIHQLEKLDDFHVVSRKASFYFKNKDLDLQTIAKRLNADLVLEGSLRRDQDRVRIAAQLIDSKTGVHEWSEVFEDTVEDVLFTQQRLALGVVHALGATLGAEQRVALSTPPTEDRHAYSLYLEGRTRLRRGTRAADLAAARNYFNAALERDPRFVAALGGLCETELAHYSRTLAPNDYARAAGICARVIDGRNEDVNAIVALGTLNQVAGNAKQALALFDRAIELRPRHQPAHHGRARVLEHLGELHRAEAAFKRAVELEPALWLSQLDYGVFLAIHGRIDEAAERFREIVRLDPDNMQAHGNLGTALFSLGRWEEAESSWRRALELEKDGRNYINLGTALYYQHDFDGAISVFEEGIARFPDFYRLWGKLGAAYAEGGRPDDARSAFHQAIELAESTLEINPRDSDAIAYLGVYRARLGEHTEGLALCSRAIELAPDNPDLHYLKATALKLAGEGTEAQAAAQAAIARGYSERLLKNDPVFTGT